MKLSLPIYGDFRDLTQTSWAKSAADFQGRPQLPSFTARLDGSSWHGYSVDLRAGLSFSVIEADFRQRFSLIAEAQDCSVLRFNFCLSGSFKAVFQPSTDELLVTAEQSYLGALGGEITLASEFSALQKLVLVRVDIDPLLFKGLIGSRFDALSPTIQAILTGDQMGCCWQSSPMTPTVKVILHQLLNCPYEDSLKQLYLEGKVLELMALQVNKFTEKTELVPHSRHLKPDDIERIHYAKHILVKNLVNPPSLIDLARRASINDFKLKQGFRQVFGTTVFGYLHQHRMEQAFLLLRSTEMTVTQVAQSIGYTNPSHFSAAFKKKYGVLPKTLKAKAL